MQEFNTKLFNYDAFRGCSEGVVGVQNTLKDPRKPRTYRVLMTHLSRTYHALIALLGGDRSSRFRENAPGIIYIVYNTRDIIKNQEKKEESTKKASHNFCSRKLPENRI